MWGRETALNEPATASELCGPKPAYRQAGSQAQQILKTLPAIKLIEITSTIKKLLYGKNITKTNYFFY